MLRKMIEEQVGKLTDKEYRDVMIDTRNHILAHRTFFKKKATLNYLLNVAVEIVKFYRKHAPASA